tara:strand:+ start:225 stop:974 length:750 start_codon:yes stop_codon:yes gene_type:complete
MNFFKKDNEIIFFHNEPSITDLFPIVESKELKLNWPNKLRQDLKNRVKKDTELDMYYNHVSRCPGIFDLFKYGYVVSLHKDIMIRPRGHGFEWETVKQEHLPNHFSIQVQDKDTGTNLIPKPPWASDFIIKINTGWHVVVPKGLKFIMLPIAYPDSFEFTSTIGILDPSIATDINFQMFWNEKEDTIIKAGTPLGQLIPLSDKTFKMIQRNMNKKDLYWISKLKSAYNTGFWNYTIRKKVVDMYNKYWN